MKKYFLFVALVFLSCGAIPKKPECSSMVKAIEKAFSDEFFNSYKSSSGKVSIVTEFNDVYANLSSCKHPNHSYTVDSVNRDNSKYIAINNFSDTKIITLQLGCYNEEQSPYYVIYSTSFEKLENGELRLLTDVSPFVDTIQVRKN